ncbi:MAG: TetR/AcrR family transcriptional regulator [Streptomyces sp.]|uniref:TetR/AcrR family transcriptional regulator n=1 Tax=Streptomyces sp. TaxID=1931 RepID=UPI003D6BC66D
MAAATDSGGDGASGIGGGMRGVSGVGGIGGTGGSTSAAMGGADPRQAPLRVDAQRNLAHVLRAAREVFGELGYGAPMEDVARRARVGVGTVYRRFPSKDVLVRRIAEEETARLTEQARAALGQEDEPWSALSRFVRTSVSSGAGRLLPPRILRAGGSSSDAGRKDVSAWVPQQRQAQEGEGEESAPGLRLVEDDAASAPSETWTDGPGDQLEGHELDGHGLGGCEEDSGSAELLSVVGELVQRARDAGELCTDVTVGDVLLVIATPAPSLPDAAQQAAASKRLLDILLEGLRTRSRS